MGRKIIALWLSLAMVLSFIVVLDVIIDFTPPVKGGIIHYVNETGTGGAYTKIQDAINASSDGDTVFVYNGTYYENVVVNKTINLTGEDRDNTTINGGGSGDAVNVSANWVNITGFTITNGSSNWDDAGIEFYNAENCSIISTNIVSNLREGIILFTSSNISISGNNVSNNGWHGIIGYFSSNNTIENNNITLNNEEGIFLREDSSFNKIVKCNVSNNTAGILIDYSSANNMIENTIVSTNEHHAIWVHHSSNNNTIIGCNISNNGGYGVYIYNSIFNNITSCAIIKNDHGISLYESSNNIITSNIIKNNSWGIYYWYSTKNNIISNCDIHNNMQGIRIGHSTTTDNYIRNCNITSNKEYGLYFRSFTQSNFIYHNNIINNAIHAYDDSNNGNQWDNGYPSGGNYWSGYSGVDLNSTPSQDVPPPDGIGDTPFIIDSNSMDNYPLMFPISNFTFLYPGWNLISVPFAQSNTSLGNVLSTIEGYYDAVQWYNLSDTSKPWKHYHISKPSKLNDLYKINHFIGFWIHINEPSGVLFDYPGIQPTTNQTITLHPGWNLVGYPSLTSYNRTQGLNNLTFGTHIDAIWTYNAATQKWKQIGPSDYFETGKGYWIHVKQECEWEVPL